jgi:ABC-type glycerol-3-phosphate transport system substrate-binding protein
MVLMKMKRGTAWAAAAIAAALTLAGCGSSAAPHTGQITWIIVVSFQGCTASLHLPCMMRCCPLQ